MRWQGVPTLTLAVVLLAALPARTDTASPPPAASLVVTTSMLECAVGELLDDNAPVRLVRLIPPQGCPGHFDLSPRALPVLRAAVAVIRHDFQQVLEHKLRGAGIDGARVVAVAGDGSLLVPEHYLGLVRRLVPVLEAHLPCGQDNLLNALVRTEERVSRLVADIAARPSPWRGQQVLASSRQTELCTWLGLDVVGELARPEDLSPRELTALLDARPSMVVANLQEGTRAAEHLGQRLSCPVAVLSNFPDVEGYGQGYDELLRANLERLDRAWASR